MKPERQVALGSIQLAGTVASLSDDGLLDVYPPGVGNPEKTCRDTSPTTAFSLASTLLSNITSFVSYVGHYLSHFFFLGGLQSCVSFDFCYYAIYLIDQPQDFSKTGKSGWC